MARLDLQTKMNFKYEDGGFVFDEDLQEQFDAWIEDGNVVKMDNGYATQDSQYRNRLKDVDALKEYFYKEFIKGQYDIYAGGGGVENINKYKNYQEFVKENIGSKKFVISVGSGGVTQPLSGATEESIGKQFRSLIFHYFLDSEFYYNYASSQEIKDEYRSFVNRYYNQLIDSPKEFALFWKKMKKSNDYDTLYEIGNGTHVLDIFNKYKNEMSPQLKQEFISYKNKYAGEELKFNNGGEAGFGKGGNVSSIEKKVQEVNRLIELGNKNGISVVDSHSTWEAPMKYKPIRYSNGVLYVEYQELDLYSYNRTGVSKWETKKDKILKRNMQFDNPLNDIAKMYRKALKEEGVEFADGGEAGFDDAGTSMVLYHEKQGNWVVPKGQVYLWLYDVENSRDKLQNEEFNWVFYPLTSQSMAWQSGYISPLKKIWTKKFQKTHKGSEHLLGVIKAYLIDKENGEKELFIDMMSVNPTKKKKGIMSYMIKELRNIYKLSKEQIAFSDLTDEGKKFVDKSKYDDGGITGDSFINVLLDYGFVETSEYMTDGRLFQKQKYFVEIDEENKRIEVSKDNDKYNYDILHQFNYGCNSPQDLIDFFNKKGIKNRKKFDDGGDVRKMSWAESFRKKIPFEMVVVAKESEKDGGNEIVFNLLVEAQNDVTAYQEARKQWNEQYESSDMSIKKVYTKKEYDNLSK